MSLKHTPYRHRGPRQGSLFVMKEVPRMSLETARIELCLVTQLDVIREREGEREG